MTTNNYPFWLSSSENDTLFSNTFKYASIGIALVSPGGQWLKVNPSFCKLVGYSEEELTNKTFQDITHPDDLDSDVGYVNQMLRYEIETYQLEKRYIHKLGHYIWVLLSVSLVSDKQKNPLYFIKQIQDITQLKHAEENLRQSEKLSIAGELAAGIAHEIRNPLTAIKGFLQLMTSNKEAKTEHLEIMGSEIKRIELVLNELLLLVKPHTISFKPKDIGAIIQQVVTFLDAEALMNDIQIFTDLYCNPLIVQCDENQIKQVFINIIKNAIEATVKDKKIFVEAKREGNRAVIYFRDHGCGISKENLRKVGQPFHTTKEKGTGLGLAVSYNIIKNHNGNIQIISEENKGSTVVVTLPLCT